MAGSNSRTVADVRRDIEAEREQLAGAAEQLRESIGEATNIGAKLRAIKRGTPPVPQQAIQEAKRTTEALKTNGRT